MWTRRKWIIGTATTVAVLVASGAARADHGHGPRAKLIKGTPDKVDFGHGLLIPLGSGAFHTLWEGDDRWMTFGHGFGNSDVAAMDQAAGAAAGTMKLYLLTLAFAPDRLAPVDGGGWVLKSGKTSDLVFGDLPLPGRPVMPKVEKMYDFAAGEGGDEGGGKVHATSAWSVWKDEVNLDYVRAKAVIP